MNSRKNLALQLTAIQDRLGNSQGPRYWRSLEEMAGSEAFREFMRGEFPQQADVWPDSLSRRKFLTLMGASLAFAGLSGCGVQSARRSIWCPSASAGRGRAGQAAVLCHDDDSRGRGRRTARGKP